MKPLDSLALMLVLSSGAVPTISARDSIKNEIQKSSLVVTVPNVVQKEHGTFSATELYWSKENSEVYFKGKVRVNFKEQHFQGRGSFTFLGKIQLLVVDGQQVALGTMLKLADGDYELVVLDSKEAVEKYGDKGVHGAVEISRKQ